jgi:hypothetical protein
VTPDHPLANSPPPPPPPPVDPPPQPPTPPVATGDCTTLKPVADWLCVNGQWVGPDHPLAQMGPGNPPPPPPPGPPPASGGCTGPDPFLGTGLTGVCVNGSWIPSDHPLAEGISPSTELTGTYTLSITADGPCISGFPQELKRREYTATVDHLGTTLSVSVSGADFVNGKNSFSGRVSPTGEINFWMNPATVWDYTEEQVVELLSDGSRLCVAGTIVATSTPTGISGTASHSAGATLYVCSGPVYTVHSGCPIERFELVRR